MLAWPVAVKPLTAQSRPGLVDLCDDSMFKKSRTSLAFPVQSRSENALTFSPHATNNE
jgi:hypothetical protein